MGAIRQFPRRQELTLNFGEQGGQPERRFGQFHKSKSLGRRRITIDVRRPEQSFGDVNCVGRQSGFILTSMSISRRLVRQLRRGRHKPVTTDKKPARIVCFLA
jgi:hypothetical protein